MKNYLGNLIARHMNDAQVLQPRLASRFEPQSSVLQSDELQPETAKTEATKTAETLSPETLGTEAFGADADVVVPLSARAYNAPVSAPVFATPVAPIPSEIEHRVEDPSRAVAPSAKGAFESSGPVPTVAELTSPTIAASDDFDNPSIAGTTSKTTSDRHDEPTNSPATSPDRVASTSRVNSDDNFTSESRSVAPAHLAMQSGGELTTDPSWTSATDQVAVPDHVTERTSREASPPTQPVTANEPSIATEPPSSNEPFTAVEPVTANKHVVETARATPSLRATPAKPNQPPAQRPIETQQSVSTPTIETGTQPAATATKRESLAATTKSEPFVSSVSHLEGDSSIDPSQPQQPNRPAAIERSSRESLSTAVVPEPEEGSPVGLRASQAAQQHSDHLPEESRSSQAARSLKTSVATSRVNPNSPVNELGTIRSLPQDNIAPAEPGPTINVTIGRIEVRAATADARPQKQRREQQVLSLDDYLNQRSAGGR